MRAVFLAGALTVAVPSVAFAGDTALAEQLFSEGLAAMKAERWQAACEAFAGSNQADPSPGTQINLGVCNEKQKKYATALTWFDAAARLAEDQGREDRAKLARSEHARVEPKVHKLVISSKSPVEGATITRNGEKLPAAALVGRETPLDPGKYTFELSAKGKKPVSMEVSIPDTPGKSSLAFPPLEDAPVDQSAQGGPAPGEPGYTPPVVVSSDGSGQRTVGIVVGGTGILALLAAGGVQILANNEQSKSEDFKTKADTATNPADRQAFTEASSSRHDAAKNNQLIALITGAGGVVLLGVGAVLFFTAPHGSKTAGKARFVPAAGPGYAGGAFNLSF